LRDQIVSRAGELPQISTRVLYGISRLIKHYQNSSITLIECVNNFLSWTGASIPQALKTVTATPAAMLGLQGTKGCLEDGADADLVVFSEKVSPQGAPELVIDEVWKFGTKVYSR